MSGFARAGLIALLVVSYAALGRAQTAMPPPDLLNPQIEVEYAVPRNPALAQVYGRLKNRRALELFRQFLAPLKFKSGQKLTLKLDECGRDHVQYNRQTATATVCYELVDEIERLAPTANVQLIQTSNRPVVRPDAALVGPFVQAVLHEVAFATFDLLEVPVWGHKDDAADRLAALVMLRFNKTDMAWTAIVGTAWFLAGSTVTAPDFSDIRGIVAQRYYTMLCMAVGADPKTFGSFVRAFRGGGDPAAGDLPDARAMVCGEEYAALSAGAHALIGPHLDGALLEKVQAVKWF
jgi:hypothetical protein